jgi:hypothetical protein
MRADNEVERCPEACAEARLPRFVPRLNLVNLVVGEAAENDR